MRIIKHGNQLLYREQDHTCTQCGCVFKYTLTDVENYIDYQQEQQEFISKIYVRCPECHLAFFIEPAAASSEDSQTGPAGNTDSDPTGGD